LTGANIFLLIFCFILLNKTEICCLLEFAILISEVLNFPIGMGSLRLG